MEDSVIRGEAGIVCEFTHRVRCCRLSFLLLLFCCHFSSSAFAAPSEITVSRVEVGFAGKYRSGFWTPVALTLKTGTSNHGSELQLISQDGDNVPVQFFSRQGGSSGEIALGETIHTYVKVGPQKGPLSVRLVETAGGKVLWQTRLSDRISPPLPSTTPLVVTLGPSLGAEEALRLIHRGGGGAPVAADVGSAANLPEYAFGYEGVETILLSTSEAGLLDQLSPRQAAAILEWVEGGGRLLLSCGARAKTLAAAGSLWKGAIPGQVAEVTPLRDASTLEAQGSDSLQFADDAARPPVARLTSVHGTVELTQGPLASNVPLVMRTPRGLGEVVFVAFDLDHPRIASWPGRSRFLSGLLRTGKSAGVESTSGASATRLGYTDLSGQLRSALDQFPGVHATNFTTVALLIIAYVLLIGPLDYLTSQKLGISRTITWVTFPLVALLFCVIGWYAAGWSHGNSLRLNQAEIVDIDAETGIVRGTAWLHVYSPVARVYDLSLSPKSAVKLQPDSTSADLTWQGLPGSGLGGLDAPKASPSGAESYAVGFPGPSASIRGLPIQVGSSKSLAAHWQTKALLPSLSRLELSEHGVPAGDLVNPLDVELEECVFTYGIWMYRLKTLGPGARFSLSDARPLYLESRLQQRTGTDFKDTATPWQRDSTDVRAILQMLMYHEAAKGEAYTGLTHRYQAHLDLSGQRSGGRGLLVGRARKPAAELSLNGSPLPPDQIQHWTYYRIVLPIAPHAAAPTTTTSIP